MNLIKNVPNHIEITLFTLKPYVFPKREGIMSKNKKIYVIERERAVKTQTFHQFWPL